MKKFIIAAIAVITLSTSAFAGIKEEPVSNRTLSSFKAEFKDAVNTTWSVKDNFYKASFLQNGVKMEAFFDFNGELIGTSKAVSVDQLPANTQKQLEAKYAGYTITEAIEFIKAGEGVNYYVSVTKDGDSRILSIDSYNTISIFKK